LLNHCLFRGNYCEITFLSGQHKYSKISLERTLA